MRASSENTPSGIKRKPDNSGDGLDAVAIRASGLSGEGAGRRMRKIRTRLEACRSLRARSVVDHSWKRCGRHQCAIPCAHRSTRGIRSTSRIRVAKDSHMVRFLLARFSRSRFAFPLALRSTSATMHPTSRHPLRSADQSTSFRSPNHSRKARVLYFFPAAFSEPARSRHANSPKQYRASPRSRFGHRCLYRYIHALAKFSVQACQSRFPWRLILTDVIKSYTRDKPPSTNRITYVIAPARSSTLHS